MEECREAGCSGTMTMNKKGIYVCPDCGFKATYYELHPEENEVKVTNKTSVSEFIKMRRSRDQVQSILADTELILFDPIMPVALRYLIKATEGVQTVEAATSCARAKEMRDKIDLLKVAARRRPTIT